jgi:hypothetical protein
MKSFKEQLRIVNDNGCSICDICIAGACEAIFEFQYTDEDFERLCKIARNAYLASDDIIEDEIAYAINSWMLVYNDIDALEEKSKWDILNAAVDGWDFDDVPLCEGWTSPEDCKDCPMIECNCNPRRQE